MQIQSREESSTPAAERERDIKMKSSALYLAWV